MIAGSRPAGPVTFADRRASIRRARPVSREISSASGWVSSGSVVVAVAATSNRSVLNTPRASARASATVATPNEPWRPISPKAPRFGRRFVTP